MSKLINKFVVILGPTSSGKSSLAIETAKRWNGEVVSVDSRQIYRGMDIGTGKVPRDKESDNKEQELRIKNQELSNEKQALKIKNQEFGNTHYFSSGILHHLLDIADPNDDYNISYFIHDAPLAIDDILLRGKLPILCGGTGFWIQTLIENNSLPNVPPNPVLRDKLGKLGVEELFSMLTKLDPKRAETIDRKNPRRLMRAIEIAIYYQHQKNSDQLSMITRQQPMSNNRKKDESIIALCPPKDILNEKIRIRLNARFDEGMIEEVKQLHENGVSWERLDAFGLEYRWISRYLRGLIPLNEMREKLFFDIIHYAKRQMTWIRRWHGKNSSLHIVETLEEAFGTIQNFMENTVSEKNKTSQKKEGFEK